MKSSDNHYGGLRRDGGVVTRKVEKCWRGTILKNVELIERGRFDAPSF